MAADYRLSPNNEKERLIQYLPCGLFIQKMGNSELKIVQHLTELHILNQDFGLLSTTWHKVEKGQFKFDFPKIL